MLVRYLAHRKNYVRINCYFVVVIEHIYTLLGLRGFCLPSTCCCSNKIQCLSPISKGITMLTGPGPSLAPPPSHWVLPVEALCCAPPPSCTHTHCSPCQTLGLWWTSGPHKPKPWQLLTCSSAPRPRSAGSQSGPTPSPQEHLGVAQQGGRCSHLLHTGPTVGSGLNKG